LRIGDLGALSGCNPTWSQSKHKARQTTKTLKKVSQCSELHVIVGGIRSDQSAEQQELREVLRTNGIDMWLDGSLISSIVVRASEASKATVILTTNHLFLSLGTPEHDDGLCRKAGRYNDSMSSRQFQKLFLCCILPSGLAVAFLISFLLHAQESAFDRRTVCVGNLVALRLAKSLVVEQLGLTNGNIVPRTLVIQRTARLSVVCPDGGKYILNSAGVDPECTYSVL
jgi:hypothetical protein